MQPFYPLDTKPKLLKYATVALGVASTGVLVGAVIHVTTGDITIGSTGSISIDFDTKTATLGAGSDATSDIRLYFYANSPEHPSAGVLGGQQKNLGSLLGGNGYGFANKLNAGDIIGPTAPAGSGWRDVPYLELAGTGPWEGGGTGYIAGRSSSTASALYGWAKITYNDALNTITLHEFAFESTPNTPIVAGAVPEPNSLLLAAAGATGIAALRRRRKENRAG